MSTIFEVNRPLVVRPVNHFRKVNGDDFLDAIEHAIDVSDHHKTNLHLHTEGYENYDCWVFNNGEAGYALSRCFENPKSYREVVNVFSLVAGKGNGDRIIDHAKTQSDLLRLDCFDGPLVRFYGSHGFSEFKRAPNYRSGGPDVVYMRYSGLRQ